MKVQEALKSAIEALEIGAESFGANNIYIKPLNLCKSALSEVEASSTGISNNAIEKCEPVAWLWLQNGKPVNAFLHDPDLRDEYWQKKEYSKKPLYTSPISKGLAVPNDEIIHNLWMQAMNDGIPHKEPYTIRRFSELLIKQLNAEKG
jgi:hypothetical protein